VFLQITILLDCADLMLEMLQQLCMQKEWRECFDKIGAEGSIADSHGPGDHTKIMERAEVVLINKLKYLSEENQLSEATGTALLHIFPSIHVRPLITGVLMAKGHCDIAGLLQ